MKIHFTTDDGEVVDTMTVGPDVWAGPGKHATLIEVGEQITRTLNYQDAQTQEPM